MANLAILGGRPAGDFEPAKWPVFNDDDEKILLDAFRSGLWGLGGPLNDRFEKEFAEYTGAEYAVTSSSGTVALRLALEAYEIGPGDEVIIPGITWQATPAAVLDVNAIPVFADVDESTFTLDPRAAEAAVTSKTRAIMPVHIYGRMCDMDAIMEIAARYRLIVIEDCAHQHGSKWRGKNAGTIGDAGAFSLQSSKILNTGEGGITTVNEKRAYDYLQSLKSCGRAWEDSRHFMHGGSYRITELQAALGVAQLKRLDEQNRLREKNALELDNLFSNFDGLKPLRRDERITFQTYYCWNLAYEKEKWGVPLQTFVDGLNAEFCGRLGIWGAYEPMHRTSLYMPLNKKTHRLSDDYFKDINPNRFDLPVCDRVFDDIAINLPQQHLMMDSERNQMIYGAALKLRENIDELKKI